uniref:Transmembrane protein 144b n=1 Tax=Cyprinus carpio TaxID=7962 RepID=A0A8C2CXL1_CYPCA
AGQTSCDWLTASFCAKAGGIKTSWNAPLSSNEASSTDATYGFVACVIAVLLYGSYFVPVKTVNTGDGMFFQWICCSAIWFVGLVTDTLFRPSRAHPAAMLGGALWATGNITAVPVVKIIDRFFNIICASFNVSSSVISSNKFGWFGLNPEEVSKPIHNYFGAGLCLAIIFFFVRSDVQKRTSAESMPLLIDDRVGLLGLFLIKSYYDCLCRIIGCILAVFSGGLYGSAFLANIEFLCLSKIFRAGFLSGLMWGSATYAWLMANYYLSAVITFPIINAGYGLVAALWGSVVFKEVKVGNIQLFVFIQCFRWHFDTT